MFQIEPAPGGFVFNVAERLLFWDGAALSTIATFPSGRPCQAVFDILGTVHLWSRTGVAHSKTLGTPA